MQCPRCQTETVELTNNNVNVEVCLNGCSGIWFDPYIFKQLDEPHEAEISFLQKLSQGKKGAIDLEKKIDCPRCDSQPLFRRFFSVRKSVEIDECPRCAGVWLDAGELTQIYSMFETEEQRKGEADILLAELIGPNMEKLSKASEEELEKNRRLAKALKFICPSYYMKGEKEWGNF